MSEDTERIRACLTREWKTTVQILEESGIRCMNRRCGLVKVAVPAYNYPSYHGHFTYVPWTEWRAERRPTLDEECFASDHAAIMERIWSAKGGDEDEEVVS